MSEMQVRLFAIQTCEHFAIQKINKIHLEDLHEYLITSKLDICKKEYKEFFFIYSTFVKSMVSRFDISFDHNPKEI